MNLQSLIAKIFIVAFFLFPVSALACSCVGSGSPCQAIWNTNAVFSGEVQSISEYTAAPEETGLSFPYKQKSVRIAVSETFRGILNSSLVEVITGQGGGDCGYKFEKGQSYLVYAYKNEKTGKLGTGICTRTQLLSKAKEDLDYLRSLPTAASGSTIYGKVVKQFVQKEGEAYRQPNPLENILISITGKSGNFEAKTDAQGDFRLTKLPPGEYNIQLENVPENLWGYEQERKIKVYDKGCAVSYFSLETKTFLSGKLYDENSFPASEISVQLVPSDQIGNQYQKDVKFAHTDKDGIFEFRSIPDGKYYLGVRLYRLAEPTFPYPRTFYPGTMNLDEAKVITIKQGDSLKDVNFNLVQKLLTRKIEGVVIYPDGSPAANASMSVQETEYAEGSLGYIVAQTNSDGSFSLTLMNGLRYLIKPFVTANDTPSRQRHAEPIEIPANGDIKNLKFVITEPNGNCEKCLRWRRNKN